MVAPVGLEPTTKSLKGFCSNQLSYKAIKNLLKNYYLLLIHLTTISFNVNLSFHSFVGDPLWLKAKAVPPYIDVLEEYHSHRAERTKTYYFFILPQIFKESTSFLEKFEHINIYKYMNTFKKMVAPPEISSGCYPHFSYDNIVKNYCQ